MSYKISIIIPTLNEEYSLPLLLNSLVKQEIKNFEVIIADGVSEDRTKEAALRFSNQLPIRFYQSPNRSLALQRNYGAGKARGEYLLFLDADFLLFPNFTKHAELLINKKRNLVILPYLLPDDNAFVHKLAFLGRNIVIKSSLIFGIPISPTAVLLERNLFFTVGQYEDLHMQEDNGLLRRIHKSKIKMSIAWDLLVVISLRRYRRDGQFSVLYKYFLCGIQQLLSGKVKNTFEYEMGGHRYNKNHYHYEL